MNKAQTAFKVYQYTSSYLHTNCQLVKFPLSQQIFSDIQHLKHCFKECLQQKITLGLAAPQVGITKRFFIMPRNFKYTSLSPRVAFRTIRHLDVIINPKITKYSDSKIWLEESCLSVLKQRYSIQRSNEIEVQYFDINGDLHREHMRGLRARVFLHERDHLDGITIRDVEGAKKVENEQKEEESKSEK